MINRASGETDRAPSGVHSLLQTSLIPVMQGINREIRSFQPIRAELSTKSLRNCNALAGNSLFRETGNRFGGSREDSPGNRELFVQQQEARSRLEVLHFVIGRTPFRVGTNRVQSTVTESFCRRGSGTRFDKMATQRGRQWDMENNGQLTLRVPST